MINTNSKKDSWKNQFFMWAWAFILDSHKSGNEE